MKCNNNCFNCNYNDCIKEGITWEEYCEIESRKERKICDSDKGQWNHRHPEKIKQYKKKYHNKNKESENKKSREYYYKHREEILTRNKTDYIKDYKKKWMREYRKRLKEQE